MPSNTLELLRKKHLFHSTYAKVAILTLHPNSSTRIEAQASKVAPVVRTSSTRRIWQPEGGSLLQLPLNANALATLCHLSRRSLAVWVEVKEALCNRLGSTRGIFAPPAASPAAIPLAITSDWLYPLFIFFLQWSGTGTI